MISSLFNMLTSSSTTALDLSHEYPAIGTHSTMEAQRFWIPNSQSSSPAAVQTQPHVAGAQGLAPIDWEMSPQGSGFEQQPPIPCNHSEAKFFGGDLENPSAGPTAQGVSHEKCGYVWTGLLYLNGICAYARAQETETVRNPYAHGFRETSTSLTSTQNAISVAKAFAT